MSRKGFLLFLVLFFAWQAQASKSFPSTRLSFYQNNYSGEKKKSLSESESGTGFEVTTQKDGEWVSPYAKVRLSTMSGDQDFDDGGTDVDSSFTYYQGSLEVGSYFFPIRRTRDGFNVFLGLGGIISYNYISLDDDDSLNNIPATDQAFSFGYSASAGAEWILASGARKWTLVGEVSSRVESTKILKKSNFGFNAFVIGIGVAF